MAIRIASLWDPKAKAWIKGRSRLFEELKEKLPAKGRIIWIHCASAGELEQAKPLIERLKQDYPEHTVLVSFFSPSGMAAGLKFREADLLTYLPSDTAAHARRFLDLVQPELVVFVKYEYWYHHLSAISKRKIPLLLVSAIFRPGQPFFKWYGGFFRKILLFFQRIFVQDQVSADLLHHLGMNHISVSGDTRFDRVLKIVQQPLDLPLVQKFCGSSKILVAGSTWPEDEKLLQPLVSIPDLKLVIAPHEINKAHLQHIQELFPGSVLYSEVADTGLENKNVLVIDHYGMLSQLYRLASITYVGGGFNKSGIHNTLEAAVWGRPVFFGPYYKKFREARELVTAGAAKSFTNDEVLKNEISQLLTDESKCLAAGKAACAYVAGNAGATERIIDFIQENRLLTS